MRTLVIALLALVIGGVGGITASRLEPTKSFLNEDLLGKGPPLRLKDLPEGVEYFSGEQLAGIGLRTCFRRESQYPEELPDGPSWIEPRLESGQDGSEARPPRPFPELDRLPGLAKLSRVDRGSLRGNIRFHCGSTRISQHWFLTAAHCIKPETEAFDILIYPARADSLEAGLAVQPASHAICHSASDFFLGAGRFGDDIALVYVPDVTGLEEVAVTSIESAETPLLPGEIEAPYFAGWSQNSEVSKMTEDGLVIEDGARFLQGGRLQATVVGRQILRTEAVDGFGPCQGDSGGPLYVEGPNGPLVIGLLSSIVPPKAKYDEEGFQTNDNCRPQTTSFYVRTSGYSDWIRRVQKTCLQRGRFVC